jgi:ubiquinone/menaquinone biosynthesis C-methylase UbiE
MDSQKFTTIAHSDLDILSPLSSDKANRLLALLGLEPGYQALDVGCGKAEMLLRLAEQYGVRGIGLETNRLYLISAGRRVQARGMTAKVTLYETSALDFKAAPGTFDAALCIGATLAYGGYRETLRALAVLVRDGGHLLIGEPYWKRDPALEYLYALGASQTDYMSHAQTIAVGEDEGLTFLYAETSSEAEWDCYEGLCNRAVELHLRKNADDPDAQEISQRIRAWRQIYLEWGRDTLGFGLYLYMK